MSLNITFEKNTAANEYVYSDIHLDLVKETIPVGEGNLTRQVGSNDLRTDFDEQALGNSLKNLFTTRPLQRILLPEYGLDLSQFLFEPVNEYSGRLIARKIINGVTEFEPRLSVSSIDIEVDEENNRYYYKLYVDILTLTETIVYTGIIENGVFTN